MDIIEEKDDVTKISYIYVYQILYIENDLNQRIHLTQTQFHKNKIKT